MATTPSPFTDHAANILQNAAGIDDTTRADLHDIFHGSKDANELAQKLQPLAVPDQLKTDLYDTKKRFQIVGGAPNATAPVGPVGKATEALTALGQLDPRVLELAESHPKMAAAFISAATKEAPAAQEPSKTAIAGKPSAEPAPAGDAAPAPGQASPAGPDIPPTPPGHALVQSSDGAFHHIPAVHLGKARGIDPKLKVLHMAPESGV